MKNLFLLLTVLAVVSIHAAEPDRSDAQVTAEVHGGKKYLRVRLVGPAAIEFCKFLGKDPAKMEAGAIESVPAKKGKQAKSCLTRQGQPAIAGFLMDAEQNTFDLEALGYN
jgi:hypothetical protein